MREGEGEDLSGLLDRSDWSDFSGAIAISSRVAFSGGAARMDLSRSANKFLSHWRLE
jgi:hypothetical protein